MPRDQATLVDIAAACRLVIAFRGELDFDAFENDLKTHRPCFISCLSLARPSTA